MEDQKPVRVATIVERQTILWHVDQLLTAGWTVEREMRHEQ
jgi:hypothetical protein